MKQTLPVLNGNIAFMNGMAGSHRQIPAVEYETTKKERNLKLAPF